MEYLIALIIILSGYGLNHLRRKMILEHRAKATKAKVEALEQSKLEAEEWLKNFTEQLAQNSFSEPTSLILRNSEQAYLEDSATTLIETRAVRYNKGVGGRVRLTKSISIGQYASQGESKQEWREIDQGSLIITNQRLVFNGEEAGVSRSVNLEKILSFEALLDGFEINVEGKEKAMQFRVSKPLHWALLIDFLQNKRRKK